MRKRERSSFNAAKMKMIECRIEYIDGGCKRQRCAAVARYGLRVDCTVVRERIRDNQIIDRREVL